MRHCLNCMLIAATLSCGCNCRSGATPQESIRLEHHGTGDDQQQNVKTTFGNTPLGQEIGHIESLSFVHWKRTGENEITEWFVKIDAEEAANMLAAAQPYDGKPWPFISSLKGEIKTEKGNYALQMGVKKKAERPFVIQLRHTEDETAKYGFRMPESKKLEFRTWIKKHVNQSVQNSEGVSRPG